MTVVPPPAVESAATAKLADTVTRFLEEARTGPLHSGLTETINVLGTTIEMAASRDWGIRFTRALPDGSSEFRHLAGDDLTLEKAAAAYAELLSLT